jgi:catechol 2,3-dioxygenase-like lactoylglutathione lyase family enzyme
MPDRATVNLPAIDFEATSAFYGRLGFREGYRSGAWMILERGDLVMEFFPHPELKPAESWFSACLRLDDADGFFETCRAAGIGEGSTGFPRISRPKLEESGLRIGALLDPNGSLLRLIQN